MSDYKEFIDYIQKAQKTGKPVRLDKRDEVAEQALEERKQGIRERVTDMEGQGKYYQLRGRWSWFLFFFMTSMILFQFLLTYSIGSQWLNFRDYPLFLSIVIGENFLQIVAMVTVAVKFLFSPAQRLNKKD